MPSNNEDDASVSSSSSSGSHFLPRVFQSDGPKYHKEKRTILSSPRPSPAASPQQVRPYSDSQDGSAQQREEANLKRLVVMARQQQSSMTAWLASTSAGHYISTCSAVPRPRSRSLPSGPVDVDSVQSSLGSHSVDGEDESTSRSFRMRFLLKWIRPEIQNSTAAFETRSETTVSSGMQTRKVSNVTDMERGMSEDNVGEKKCGPRLIGASLVCLLVLAVITVIVSVVVSGDSSAPAAQTLGERFDSSNSPSMAPLALPSLAPTTFSSSVPSLEPTAAPSIAPSEVPTAVLSDAPTLSPAPSYLPSQSPTSLFSASVYKTLATVKGDEQLESFGSSVSLSADGNIMAVGAPDYSHDGLERSGRVQVFERSDNAGWQLKGGGGALVGRNSLDQFGHAVSLSDDGLRLAVSEIGFDGPAGDKSGNVRVFDFDGGDWRMVGQEISGEALANLSGLSLVLAGNGKRLAVGSPYRNNGDFDLSGRVHIFEWTGSLWQPVGDALDGAQSRDWFGWSIDMSHDGDSICVGAPRNTDYGGYVQCFRWTDGAWRQVGSDLVNNMGNVQLDDRFGMAVSLSEDGKVAIGAPLKDLNDHDRNSGLVVVYQWDADGEDWSLLGDAFVGLKADDRFGWSLNLSGDYLSIGIPGLNQVSIHRWTDGFGWDTVSSPLQGDQEGDQFGYCVATSSNAKVVAVGATQKPNGGTGYGRVLERL